jgi:hypothetical protein
MTVAIVENASRGDRRLFHGTLADLPALERRDELTGPVMVVIGDAVAGANFDNSTPIAAGQPENHGCPTPKPPEEATMKTAPTKTKVLTANRLTDGISVWLGANGEWTRSRSRTHFWPVMRMPSRRSKRPATGARRQPRRRRQCDRDRGNRQRTASVPAARTHPRRRTDNRLCAGVRRAGLPSRIRTIFDVPLR